LAPAKNGYKKCSTCKEYLPVSEYGKNKAQSDGYQNACNTCRGGWGCGWYLKQTEDPAFVDRMNHNCREQQLKQALKKYDLSFEDYKILEAKGCGICGGPPNGRGRYAFDHDHETGKFRGLLCAHCNTAIGLLKDSPDILEKAKQYILKTKN
jgi:hypothetical protein